MNCAPRYCSRLAAVCFLYALPISVAIAAPEERPGARLPDTVGEWRLERLRQTDTMAYGRRHERVEKLVRSTEVDFTRRAGAPHAAGLLFLVEEPADSAQVLQAMGTTNLVPILPDGMSVGNQLTMHELMCVCPVPLNREAAANVLDTEQETLVGLHWFVALPSPALQKEVMKELFKKTLADQELNLAARVLIRPFLGRMTSMADRELST